MTTAIMVATATTATADICATVLQHVIKHLLSSDNKKISVYYCRECALFPQFTILPPSSVRFPAIHFPELPCMPTDFAVVNFSPSLSVPYGYNKRLKNLPSTSIQYWSLRCYALRLLLRRSNNMVITCRHRLWFYYITNYWNELVIVCYSNTF